MRCWSRSPRKTKTGPVAPWTSSPMSSASTGTDDEQEGKPMPPTEGTGHQALRIITTNDFIGPFFPQPTSFGHLPGARALAAAARQCRSEAEASLWIDAGDLAQGAPLNPLTDGSWGFIA